MQLTLQQKLQHHLNSMHIYSRLCYVMPSTIARTISRVWEKVFHPLLYTIGRRRESLLLPRCILPMERDRFRKLHLG